jgi:hypothetical protein
MLQHYYPVPVVKSAKYPSTAAITSSKKNADQRGRVRVLGRDRSQREPNLGNMVNVPTIHSTDPLIFPLPKHFRGRVHCADER